ncbi:MAG: hypothetical protein IJP62_07930 [Treponema sp.]|nr:hypothetical protein [Treponema sp.]
MRKLFVFAAVVIFLFCSAGMYAQDLSNAILAKSDTAISSVTWNSDGKLFATTWNNSVILWDAESNTVLSVYSGHTGPIKKVRFSKDDQWLLSVGQDNTVIIRKMDEQGSASKINGSGYLPMRDAVFVNNGYSIMAPLDGFNTNYCFRLMLTGQFVSKPVSESAAPIYALDINDDGSLLLVGAQDGTVQIIDTATYQVVSVFPRYVLSQIPPVFTPDGRHFLSAADKTNLIISPVGGNDAIVIRDGDQPVNSAVVSNDGRMVATATKNGMIKVYDTADSTLVYQFTMSFSPMDVVNSLAFSPDGEFLLAGTEAGYILRWSLTGKVFVPIRKSYENQDLINAASQYDENGRRRNAAQLGGGDDITKLIPKHQIGIELGFNTLTSNDYVISIDLGASYRNYQIYPFYWGGGIEFGLGIPSSNFTYTYTLGDSELPPPYIDSIVPYALAGIAGLVAPPEILLFAEFTLGPSFRFLCTNSISRMKSGSLYAGVNATFMTGAQWRFLRSSIGVAYDSNYEFMFRAFVGGVIRFNEKPKKKKPSPEAEAAKHTPLGRYESPDTSPDADAEDDSDFSADTDVTTE